MSQVAAVLSRGAALCLLTVGAWLGLMAPGVAQTLTEREARQQVAPPRGISVELADLPINDPDMLKRLEAKALQFPYYGAFVTSPGDPAENQSAFGLANLHSPQDAVRVALATCEARRTTGAPCILVAQTFPRRYQAGVLTLSAKATEVLRGAFRQLDSPKAFAISDETGQFGFARGDGTRALANCNAAAGESGVQDCRLVVVDR